MLRQQGRWDKTVDTIQYGWHDFDDRLERKAAIAFPDDGFAGVEVEYQVDPLPRSHVELVDQLDAALDRAGRIEGNLVDGAARHHRIGHGRAGIGIEHQAQLRVAAGRQRGLPQVFQGAIGQVQEVDLARRAERDIGPARIGIARRGALVHADLVDGHVDGVKAARWRIGDGDAQSPAQVGIT
ncbi:hypothetical protein D3C81_1679070 [compost metagenome]